LLIAVRQSDNTRTGATSHVEFEGSHVECLEKQAWLTTLGPSELDLYSVGNGYWRVTATLPYGFDGQTTNFPEVPNIHELQVNVGQLNVWRSPKLRTLLTSKQIGIVQRVVNDYRNGEYQDNEETLETAEGLAEVDVEGLIEDTEDSVAGRTNIQAQADGVNLFRAVAYIGVEDFIEETNTYRRTITAATPEQVRATFEGQGKIWTTPEVTAYEGLAVDGWFQLPASSLWRKSRPEVVAAAGQKTQVVYTYTECATALGLIYDAHGSATLLYPPSA